MKKNIAVNNVLEKLVEIFIGQGNLHETIKVAKLIGRKITIRESNILVKKKINDEYAHIWEAKEAARLAKRKLTKNELKKKMKCCIKEGETEEASEIAKLSGRRLKISELDQLVKANLTKDFVSPHEVYKAFKLGASDEAKRSFLEFCKKTSIIDLADAAKKAKKCLSVSDLNSCVRIITKKHIENLYKDALDIIKLGASENNYNLLIMACVKKGMIDETFKIASIAKRKLTTSEIDKLILKNLDNINATKKLLELAKLGASSEVKGRLLKVFLEQSYAIDETIELLKLIGRYMTVDEAKAWTKTFTE